MDYVRVQISEVEYGQAQRIFLRVEARWWIWDDQLNGKDTVDVVSST